MADPESTFLFDGPANAHITVALAHGAGAGMDTPFMAAMANGLGDAGFRVLRFEFPYMADARAAGRRRPPNREPILRESWQAVIARQEPDRLVVGGKSLGGRIASLVADEAGVLGLCCLGYPFHPPGRPEKPRTQHLETLRTPTLICQGTRDPFGTVDDVADYRLSPSIELHWLEDGDHSFAPRRKSGRTTDQNWQDAVLAMVGFINRLDR